MARKQNKIKRPKSYAARFREVFEVELKRIESGEPRVKKPAPPLARGPQKQPVITEVDGQKKYLYKDGSIDTGSIVSPEVEERALEIGEIALRVKLQSESDAQEVEYKPAGSLATREFLAA